MSVSCGADGIFQTSPHNLVLSRFRCERADSGEDSERHARQMQRARHVVQHVRLVDVGVERLPVPRGGLRRLTERVVAVAQRVHDVELARIGRVRPLVERDRPPEVLRPLAGRALFVEPLRHRLVMRGRSTGLRRHGRADRDRQEHRHGTVQRLEAQRADRLRRRRVLPGRRED